jgi:S-adenosylmethionine-diacylgycerolhomoserine-N-methlytransferase
MTSKTISDPQSTMNNMYRWTRHVYDASRKYFLFGRDYLIEKLNAKSGEIVIEVGCGTARNLRKMAKAYPQASFYGLDAADEMLKTARQSLAKENLDEAIPLAQGLAQTFSPKSLFDLKMPPDKIVFSYILSMIPDAQKAIDHAYSLLPSGGEIHIVDFSNLSGYPAPFRVLMRGWLKLFHVVHDPELLDYIKKMPDKHQAELTFTPLYRNYSYYCCLKKP